MDTSEQVLVEYALYPFNPGGNDLLDNVDPSLPLRLRVSLYVCVHDDVVIGFVVFQARTEELFNDDEELLQQLEFLES